MLSYQKSCTHVSGCRKFLNILAIAVATIIGFALGAAIGTGIGLATGAVIGPGAAATGAVGLIAGAFKGASLGCGIGIGLVMGGATTFGLFKKSPLIRTINNDIEQVIASVGR